MYRYFARFNGQDFNIKELPNLEDSSRETKFSSIEVDFRGKAENLIPIQLQEIQIIQKDELDAETIIMTCYAESVEYPEFTFEAQPFFLTINLLSPYAYASKRTTNKVINNIALNTSIVNILSPLIDDGFTIETNELDITPISEIFSFETIEKVMNYLANKYKFIWYIDNLKKIYIKTITNLSSQAPVLSINDGNKCNLAMIKPSKNLVDYANKLNIKNTILIDTRMELIPSGTTLSTNQTYTFRYPISLSINTCSRLTSPAQPLKVTLAVSETIYEVSWNGSSLLYSGVGIDGEDTIQPVMLIPDSNDSTRITGFKWTGTDGVVAANTESDTALVPLKSTFIDAIEIGKVKGKMNTSGIVEKIIDTNGKYFLINELESFAVNLFSQNNVVTNDLECKFKGRLNDNDFINILDLLKITNVFNVELPQFNVSGNFIITDRSYKANMHTAEINIKARNYNLNENYLDIYRVNFEQEQEDKINTDIISFYNQDEKLITSKEIYVNGVLVNEV